MPYKSCVFCMSRIFNVWIMELHLPSSATFFFICRYYIVFLQVLDTLFIKVANRPILTLEYSEQRIFCLDPMSRLQSQQSMDRFKRKEDDLLGTYFFVCYLAYIRKYTNSLKCFLICIYTHNNKYFHVDTTNPS